MAKTMASSTHETVYRVRRGGTKRPVGTLLTSDELVQIKNHKALLATGHLVPVVLERRNKEKNP